MDKTVTLAVAGSGKTRSIVNKLDLDHRALLITYTNNAQEDIRRRLIAKFGHMPANITVSTYFTFLNRFCYRPLLFRAVRDRGISFHPPARSTYGFTLNDLRRYMDSDKRLYHCRMAKLLDVRNRVPNLLRRIERYYDGVFVDEVQDFGGHDFNLLMQLSQARVSWNLVGDFYQHTFSTSHDGTVNRSLHHDFGKFQNRFIERGFNVDTESLVDCHRCSETVCAFIRDQIGIDIKAASSRTSDLVVVEDQAEADRLHADPSILKLFLMEHELYSCNSLTWGSAKGLDHHQDVCVVLNDKTWRLYLRGELRKAKPTIRNKLYVACSRPRRHLYLMPESILSRFKAQRVKAKAGR